MATYYWYGGAGNWSDYTNHWSTNSGNSPSAPAPNAPTSADNVIFDDNSHSTTFTVTVNATSECADFTCSITNAAKKMTLAGSAALNVYGSWSNPASTLYASTYSGTITFSATTTGKTITTNAVTLGGVVAFSGVGGEWTLSGALTSGSNTTINKGSLVTNNNNLTVNVNLTFASTADAKSLTLGSSTVLIGGAFGNVNTSNLTLDAGTSTITLSNSFTSFNGMSKTFYNVTFSSAGPFSATSGGIVMTGANTFNNLTYTSRTGSIGSRLNSFDSNIVINGTLTCGVANAVTQRMLFASDIIGAQRTITLNGTLAALADVDFRDINAAGTVATPWTGTRLGNAKNVSNITTATPKTVYWNLAGTQNWSAVGWATTNNGAPASTNFPLPQDTAVFTEAGAAGTVTIEAGWNIGTIQMADGVSNRTTAFTLTTGVIPFTIYGDVTLFSSLTLSGTAAVTFAGQGGTQTITSAGISFTQPWTINNASGTFTLAANTTLGSTLATTLTSGTFNVNGKTFTTGTFVSTGALTRAITFGTNGKIVVAGSGASAWSTSGSGLTTTGTTATISMTSASAKTFAGGGFNYAATLSQDGAGALTISGSNTFANITNTTQPVTITFTAGTTQTVSSFTASGTAGNLVTLQSSSAGSRFTLSDSSGANTVSYCSIKDSIATGGATWQALTADGNVDAGNNLGWIFSTIPVTYEQSQQIKLRSMAQRGRF